MTILISGGTGLVGTELVHRLQQRGHTVHVLVRHHSDQANNRYFWNYGNKEIDGKAFEGVQCLIHLAGASIGSRWTDRYKSEIISSRVESANFLLEQCKIHKVLLRSFISASGINYYGTFTSDQVLDEETGIMHRDFLSDVCNKWEDAARQFSAVADKTVILRTAPVLSKNGGTFEQLKKISDFNLAAGIGTGKQWFNWIHLDDLVNLYIEAVENPKMEGVYNAVADEIPTNREFMEKLAKLNRKFFLPVNVPAAMIKLMLGEMSDMILEGSRVSNQKVRSLGFDFKYAALRQALPALI